MSCCYVLLCLFNISIFKNKIEIVTDMMFDDKKKLRLFLIRPFQIILNINCGNNIVKYEKSLR